VTRAPLPPDVHGLYLALVRTLATRTAQLHRALAAAREPQLAPQALTAADVAAWRAAARRTAAAALKLLGERIAQLPAAAAADARTVLARRSALLRSLAGKAAAVRGVKTRCHGDYQLRRVLLKRNDFVITGFEAAAAAGAAASERCSPLRDVASMLRSFANARRKALQQCSLIPADERSGWEAQLDDWEQQTRRVFVSVYDEIAREGGLYASFAAIQPLLRAFEIEAACVELQRELLGPPEWAGVGLRTLAALSA